VPFTVTIGLPEGVTATGATCAVAGVVCTTDIVDASTITASGELPAGDLGTQPNLVVSFTVTEQPQPVPAPRNVTACTVIGPAGSTTSDAQLPAGSCAGTETTIAFNVAPTGGTAGTVVLPGTGDGTTATRDSGMMLLATVLATLAAMMVALTIRLRRR
jgi:hypothetical protein